MLLHTNSAVYFFFGKIYILIHLIWQNCLSRSWIFWLSMRNVSNTWQNSDHFPNTLNIVNYKKLCSLLSVWKCDETPPCMFDSFTHVHPQRWKLIIVVLILVLVPLHLLFLLPLLLLQNHLLVFLWGCAKHSDPNTTKQTDYN